MSNDISIRRGETLELYITIDNEDAESVRLVVAKDYETIIDETTTFSTVDGTREATLTTDDTNHVPGSYDYMLIVTYSDGVVEKLPEGSASDCDSDCDDGCGFPQLVICKTLSAPGVS